MIAAFYKIEKQKDCFVLQGNYTAAMKVIVWLSNVFLATLFIVPTALLYVQDGQMPLVGILISFPLIIIAVNYIIMIGSGRHHTATFDFRRGTVSIKNIYPLFPWLFPTIRIHMGDIAALYLSHYHIPSSLDQPEVNCESFYVETLSKRICITKRIDCSQGDVIDGVKELMIAFQRTAN